MKRSETQKKLKKNDWIAMILITLVYGIIALYNLGNMDAAQSYGYYETPGDVIDLDFSNKSSNIKEIHMYLGRKEDRTFYLQESWDNVNWAIAPVNDQDPNAMEEAIDAGKFTVHSVFSWSVARCNVSAPYVRLFCSTGENFIHEVVFKDEAGNQVVPLNAQNYEQLFDEQDLFPEQSTYRNGTYFDEIYHGRTAYEMVEGVYCYENTHPPLGKFIISIGIRLFGMCPFGWRIMGTLFGIAMLPILYLFTRRMFKETWFATIATVLFAADFMHFTQTRIATIDVFVTFFVILMYYYMYQYTQLSFYDTPLKKTFRPLLFCGIAMGLGCACKWPGVYAGIGLSVIFFATLIRRYLEYRKAKVDPTGTTNGLEHKKVTDLFVGNTIRTLAFCLLAFVVIPGVIYTLSYIPFEDDSGKNFIQQMIKNQQTMFQYHSGLEATHYFSSWFYEWPIIRKPIWYYTGVVSGDVQENISAFGNPMIWWAGIPAFLYMVYLVIRRKDGKAAFLSVAYLAQYLPWFNVSRITFIYHYFPSVPFVTIMIVYCMYTFCKRTNGKYEKQSKKLCLVYAAIAVGLFFLFYPVLSGYPMEAEFARQYLKWFDSWVLVKS